MDHTAEEHSQYTHPPTSAAADMARQLAMGGMNTDALLEALASLPKVGHPF